MSTFLVPVTPDGAQKGHPAACISRPGDLWASGFAAGSRGFTRQAWPGAIGFDKALPPVPPLTLP
jgi:hypothetical protein